MKAKPWWQALTPSAVPHDMTRSSIDLSTSAGHWNPRRLGTRREFRLVEHRDHQAAIRHLYAAHCGGTTAEGSRITVRIVRVQNRIKATTLSGTTLGFFSRKDTETYTGMLGTLAQQFDEIRCPATVEIDWNGELFIALDISSPTP